MVTRMSSLEDLKKQLLEDPTIQNNINAANQLANATERDEAIRILRQGFEITNPTLHVALINALVKHGAKEAIPQVSACLKSPDATERNAAYEALVRPSLRDAKVVKIFGNRLRFERDNNIKILIIQKLAQLPYEQAVDLLLRILKDGRYKVTPFVEHIRNSLTSLGPKFSQKLIKELGSPIGNEITNILSMVNLSAHPEVWATLVKSLDEKSEELYQKMQKIIVAQITRDYNEQRVGKLMENILSPQTSGKTKERSIVILDAISKTPHGPKLVKPTLKLVQERTQGEVKREKFIRDLELEISHFEIAEECFKEVDSSYVQGNFRAAIILGISALESCIKTDYVQNVGAKDRKNEEQSRKYVRKTPLSVILDRYFDKKDVGRLPSPYKPFMDIHRKIRNSLVHPEQFTFTEPMVRQTLTSIAELIKYLEAQQK